MKILAVVVRYNMALESSQTMMALSREFHETPDLASSIRIFIWDNSPEALLNPQLPFPFEYSHSKANVGLSGAYNRAAALAHESAVPWLLLLDQDTTLPQGFLSAMLKHAADLEGRKEIAAIVPTVLVGDFVASPRHLVFPRSRPYPSGQSGIAEGEPGVINSGSMLRVADLLEIGGYSQAFWLDYSDYYVFHQFFLWKKKVWIAAEIRVQHSMTVMDYDKLMSTWRYRNFSYAETAYHDLYKGRFENAVQTLRLLARTVKQRRKYKNPEFSRIAWSQFVYRLRVPRKQRVARWKADRGSSERNPAEFVDGI